MIDYKKLIESGFNIIDVNGKQVPFNLNKVQIKYLGMLEKEYPTMEGIRENILKARKEGFSSFIDALFVVDFLSKENIGAQIISHKDKETKILMKRVHFFIDSFCEKLSVDRKGLLKTDREEFLENKSNGSFIFIGTAGAKTLGRGPTLQNIHWSECGFYPNTEIINAERLVMGAEEQVAHGVGKIFRESTGNLQGDFFYDEVERSRKKESPFKFRFFAWFEHDANRIPVEVFEPTDEERQMMLRYKIGKDQIAWYRQKMSKFKTKALGLREHPTTPEEAFLAGGSTFFDIDVLKSYLDRIDNPIKEGQLGMDGDWI